VRPRFITFEGLDGSGKSTHLRRAARLFRERGMDIVETQEPGGTALGRAIREVFLDRRWGSMDGRVEAMLVFASRRLHLLEVIDPALARGATVFCDRFTDSTLAYQGYGRGVSLEVLGDADELATGRRVPHHTILFDLPAAEARRRGQSEERTESGEVDRLDAEELEFYERVRLGYLELAEREPNRFSVVDSSGSLEATERQTIAVLEKILEGAS
jgi:dTMP kinase